MAGGRDDGMGETRALEPLKSMAVAGALFTLDNRKGVVKCQSALIVFGRQQEPRIGLANGAAIPCYRSLTKK